MSDEANTEVTSTEEANTAGTTTETTPFVAAPPVVPTPVTSDEEAANMQAGLDAYNAQKAAEAAQARVTKLKPITDLTTSDAYKEVSSTIQTLASSNAFSDEPNIIPHLNALSMILPALAANAS